MSSPIPLTNPLVRPAAVLTATLTASSIPPPVRPSRPSASDLAAYAAAMGNMDSSGEVGQPYPSVAPVVASVDGQATVTPYPLPVAPSGALKPSYKGVFIGAVLGLALVCAFVAGTRLATNSSATPAFAAFTPPQRPLAERTPPAAVTAAAAPSSPAGVPVTKLEDLPSVPLSQLPVARATPRAHAAAKGSAAPGKAAPEASAGDNGATAATTEPQGSSAAAPAAPAKAAPAAAKAAKAPKADDDEESAPAEAAPAPAAASPAPAATLDPFLRAIKEQVDEDSKPKGH